MKLSNLLLALATGALFVSAAPTPMQVDELVKTLASRSNTSSTSPGKISIPFKKHKRSKASEPASKRDAQTGNVVLSTLGDLLYLGEISIGTPGQTLKVVLDTGSSQLAVTTPQYNPPDDDDLPPNFPKAATFDSTQSSTLVDLHRQVSSLFGDTTGFNGELVQDTVAFGGCEIANLPFVTITAGNISYSGVGSGIFGLGWSSVDSGPGIQVTIPFLELLWRSGVLSQPLFSLSLWGQQYNPIVQDASSTDRPLLEGGELLIGGVDDSQFEGDITYQPLVIDPYITLDYPSRWKSTVQGVIVNDNFLPDSQFDATFDSGSSTSHLPQSLMNNLLAQLDPKYQITAYPSNGGFQYSFQCPDDFQPFTFTLSFGGQQFDIPFSNLLTAGGRLTGDGGEKVCVLSVESWPTRPDGYIIGDDILKSLYVVYRFDPPSIGLARLSSAVTGSENPQPSQFKNIPTETDAPPPGGAPFTPVFATPTLAFSSLAATLYPKEDPTAYWFPNTTSFALEPSFVGTTAIPTATFASQTNSPGSTPQGGKSRGNTSGSQKTSPFSFSVAVGVTLLSFVFSSALL